MSSSDALTPDPDGRPPLDLAAALPLSDEEAAYVEAARVLAQRILSEVPSAGTADRLEFALKTVLGRAPTPAERRVLTEVLDDVRHSYAADAKSADALTRQGNSPRTGDIPTAELAAWTGVANVILNLDETVTRE